MYIQNKRNGAVKMTKRYFVEYESDRIICRSNVHEYGRANSLKTAKGYISRIKKNYADENPRNFRIYDIYGECGENEHVPCVYSE